MSLSIKKRIFDQQKILNSYQLETFFWLCSMKSSDDLALILNVNTDVITNLKKLAKDFEELDELDGEIASNLTKTSECNVFLPLLVSFFFWNIIQS